MQRQVSPPLTVAVDQPVELASLPRADLVFYRVDHSGQSYEGRVFSTSRTPTSPRRGIWTTATPARSTSSATVAATATRDIAIRTAA